MSRKRKQKGAVPVPDDGSCWFCLSKEDNEEKYGKLHRKDDVTVHYFCLLFASGLGQNGEDDEGLFGFLPKDILQEFRRGSKLRCSYCREFGATVGCCKGACRIQYHFGCGHDNHANFHFYDDFSSVCVDHRPVQEVRMNTSSRKCSICLCPVYTNDAFAEIKATCCANGVFHRHCVQRQATMSGVHFFKCALCNNTEKFQKEMLRMGIYIPDKDAEWELETGAYQELLERHSRCDIKPCKCPTGPDTNDLNTKYEVMLCDSCGSVGTHLACSDLKCAMDDWECAECAAITAKTKAEAPKPIFTSPKPVTVADILSAKSPIPIVKAKKMTAQELQAKKFMLKYNGSLSSPTSLPTKRKLTPAFVQPAAKKHCNEVRNTSSRELSVTDSKTSSSKAHDSSRRRKVKSKKRKRKRGEEEECDPKQKRKVCEVSEEAMAAVAGVHVAPKPRQTRRSMQAGEALAQIRAEAADPSKLPRNLASIITSDIFTGRNVGSKWADAFAVESNDAAEVGAARCRLLRNRRTHLNPEDPTRRTIIWRFDISPERAQKLLKASRKKKSDVHESITVGEDKAQQADIKPSQLRNKDNLFKANKDKNNNERHVTYVDLTSSPGLQDTQKKQKPLTPELCSPRASQLKKEHRYVSPSARRKVVYSPRSGRFKTCSPLRGRNRSSSPSSSSTATASSKATLQENRGSVAGDGSSEGDVFAPASPPPVQRFPHLAFPTPPASRTSHSSSHSPSPSHPTLAASSACPWSEEEEEEEEDEEDVDEEDLCAASSSPLSSVLCRGKEAFYTDSLDTDTFDTDSLDSDNNNTLCLDNDDTTHSRDSNTARTHEFSPSSSSSSSSLCIGTKDLKNNYPDNHLDNNNIIDHNKRHGLESFCDYLQHYYNGIPNGTLKKELSAPPVVESLAVSDITDDPIHLVVSDVEEAQDVENARLLQQQWIEPTSPQGKAPVLQEQPRGRGGPRGRTRGRPRGSSRGRGGIIHTPLGQVQGQGPGVHSNRGQIGRGSKVRGRGSFVRGCRPIVQSMRGQMRGQGPVNSRRGRMRGSVVRGGGSIVRGRGSIAQRRGSNVRGRGSIVRGHGSIVRGRGSFFHSAQGQTQGRP